MLKTIAGFAGVTAIDFKVTFVTVSIAAGLVIEPIDAVIDVLPAATPVTTPWLPWELLIVAIAWAEELHVTEVVITFVLPSAYVPVALN